MVGGKTRVRSEGPKDYLGTDRPQLEECQTRILNRRHELVE